MPSRPTLGPGSGTIPGTTFFTEYETAMKGLWDASNLPLHSVGGTADNVTATCDWPLQAGFVDGMKFTLTWAATNTGPMTLSINGAQSVDVKSADGAVMLAGDMKAGTRVLLEYIGGEFRVLGGSGEGGTPAYYVTFTTSGTWVRPPGYDDNRILRVILTGGGAAGQGRSWSGSQSGVSYFGGGGGGGGATVIGDFRLGDVPSSVPITIGAGGVGSTGNGADGGSSAFGALLTAWPGRGGTSFWGGGHIANGWGAGLADEGANSIYGGGGGGSDVATVVGGNNGGGGYWGAGGGGGGGATSGGSGGASVFSGAGGDGAFVSTAAGSDNRTADGAAGLAPGGGGGGCAIRRADTITITASGGDGAGGRCIVTII